jgi:NADH-quinone oxidoreductase subunit D
MKLNIGPSHPVTHGTVRLVVELDGEVITKCDVEVGYLHRGFEKECERVTYLQVFPYTDRLNYVSPFLNNVGFAMAVEKLCGLTESIPERAQYIRVIMGELSRICDHLTCLAAGAMELGGFTPFLYGVEAREEIYRLIEEVTGARLTVSYGRIGGVAKDLTPDFIERYREVREVVLRRLDEVDRLLTRLRIFMDRMQGTGVFTREFALAHGFTGPMLRSTGVDYDIRKDHPYLVYDRFDWEVPVGTKGDNYDRFLLRMEEIRQSIRICDQALEQLPGGPVILDDWRYVLPPKPEVWHTIEGCIAHFELVMFGPKVPKGEAYGYTEGGNGELGFYVVSDGSGRPYRMHVRAPCFALMQGLDKLLIGGMLSDIPPTFDMLNLIAGECDR